jgi:hypothetical protein
VSTFNIQSINARTMSAGDSNLIVNLLSELDGSLGADRDQLDDLRSSLARLRSALVEDQPHRQRIAQLLADVAGHVGRADGFTARADALRSLADRLSALV